MADDEEKDQKPKRACDRLRGELLQCLIYSDCVQRDRRTPKDCLQKRGDPSVPDECHQLRTAFFNCKRSLIDMRTRFRGIKD